MKGAIATHRPRATVSHRGQPLAAVITARPQADHLYGGRTPERHVAGAHRQLRAIPIGRQARRTRYHASC